MKIVYVSRKYVKAINGAKYTLQ